MFVCNGCGYKSAKWLGKCPLCSGWETFAQEVVVSTKKSLKDKKPPKVLKEIQENQSPRIPSGLDEFDRVLGGGLVEGEIILILLFPSPFHSIE